MNNRNVSDDGPLPFKVNWTLLIFIVIEAITNNSIKMRFKSVRNHFKSIWSYLQAKNQFENTSENVLF